MMKLTAAALIAAAVLFSPTFEVVAAGRSAYGVVDTIAGPDGGYDYLSIDSAKQRLFIAREYGVMAVDLQDRKVIPELIKGNDVSAVLIIAGTDLMLITNWASDTATLFDRNTGAAKAQIPTGKQPDAALFEPASGLAFVMNGASKDITVIDIGKAAVVATIAVGGKPEAAVTDGKGNMYVNIEDTAEIAVIDISTLKVVKRHQIKGCIEPTGIAYDAASGLLISACHNGVAKLVNAATGADRGSVKVGKEADGAIFDSGRRLAYVPCNDGTLTIFRLDEKGKSSPVAVVPTSQGARTAALDPLTGRIYLAAADFTTDEKGERTRTPGTFKVLVVAPK